MGIEDDIPRVKQIKTQLEDRLDRLEVQIQADKKLEALSSLAWIRTHLDELLCNFGCSPLSEDVSTIK